MTTRSLAGILRGATCALALAVAPVAAKADQFINILTGGTSAAVTRSTSRCRNPRARASRARAQGQSTRASVETRNRRASASRRSRAVQPRCRPRSAPFRPRWWKRSSPCIAATIPGGHLRGADGDVLTAAVGNVFVTHAAVPEETVCPMTTLLFENLPERVAAHRASAAIALEGAPNGMPIPLHPGPGGISARSG
jgi:TRAP-type uncharacterized transport system substrate-binding protein